MDSDFIRPQKANQNSGQKHKLIQDFADIDIPDKPIEPLQHGRTLKYSRILCIEDEHFIGQLYSRALKKAGYQVRVFSDGEQALKEATTNEYDIILLDLLLPSIDGIELLKKLREANVTAKVIVTTNLEQTEESRSDLEKQADGYLVKADITPKQLVQFLQSLE